jgi:hypothetical protein
LPVPNVGDGGGITGYGELLPFYTTFAPRRTFTILFQKPLTFTLPPPYAPAPARGRTPGVRELPPARPHSPLWAHWPSGQCTQHRLVRSADCRRWRLAPQAHKRTSLEPHTSQPARPHTAKKEGAFPWRTFRSRPSHARRPGRAARSRLRRAARPSRHLDGLGPCEARSSSEGAAVPPCLCGARRSHRARAARA